MQTNASAIGKDQSSVTGRLSDTLYTWYKMYIVLKNRSLQITGYNVRIFIAGT